VHQTYKERIAEGVSLPLPYQPGRTTPESLGVEPRVTTTPSQITGGEPTTCCELKPSRSGIDLSSHLLKNLMDRGWLSASHHGSVDLTASARSEPSPL